MGLSQVRRFEKYHRILNRAKWNSVTGSKILLGLLLQLLPSSYPLLIVVDDTIERRSGKKIKAKGCYRDACPSTEAVVVTCFGLKWVCFMLIVPLPWCRRPWALPFMTILAPSKKYNEARGRRHKTSIDWTIIALRVPCLMALFSIVCLFAIEMLKSQALPILSTAWYNKKADATFSDIIAYVKRRIWAKRYFNDSRFDGDYVKIKHEEWENLLDQLSRAA